jgi:hypothetical protein
MLVLIGAGPRGSTGVNVEAVHFLSNLVPLENESHRPVFENHLTRGEHLLWAISETCGNYLDVSPYRSLLFEETKLFFRVVQETDNIFLVSTSEWR